MSQTCDLVLEGGGVKGIALAGAVLPLAQAGYRFPRIAGTSSGAVVGALVAALQRSGEPLAVVGEIARTLDYSRFPDRGLPGRLLGPLAFLADGLSLLFEGGIYEGDYLHDWMAGVLSDLGVRTFGDLRVDDPGADGEIHHRYGLVVTASDLSRHRFVKLPWEYGEYGLDPDEQSVADAVRASISIPFFFEPVSLRGAHGVATLVDGGLLSSYPIEIFDRRDEHPPRWPTIGVRVSSRSEEQSPEPVEGPVSLALSLVETALEARQSAVSMDPCNQRRSIFVDTRAISSTDFDITREQQEQLVETGRTAAEQFLQEWDFAEWLRDCRGVDPIDG
ncbi:MAG TPA: patatin-like phospholipase family protein [Nocardioidaceae bacterium]|nr:patatin-like phospholipase family protein [Nocardioidaceae bacterium]